MIEPVRVAPRAAVALVTGASRGLGRTLAGFLAGQGYAIIATARGEADLSSVAREIQARGGTCEAIAGDVSDEAHRARLLEAARRLGGLHLLINNASDLGPTPLPSLSALPPDALRKVMEVNLVAPLSLLQETLPLLEASGGTVVNISSDAAVGGYPGWGAYGASKAALDLLSKTLAEELRGRRVAVVSVDPGDMRTKMHQDAYPGQDISDRPLPDVTLPFFAWLFAQDAMRATGRRFQAQSSVWEVAA